jgi:hypothetical protein
MKPSPANVAEPTVLSTILCGDDKNPVASVTVTSWPGIVVLDRYTIAAEPLSNPAVSSWIIQVLSLTIPLMLQL